MSHGDIAISIRNLSKAYVIAHNAAKHTTLAEAMMHRLRRPLDRPTRETFWALRDLSLEIKKGEVVGIIGRNGAGKSTFLKILSRITEPTSGRIDLYGRVGSLLEVGTGFHPELTGRENIYLNGTILGMSKGEIREQFDAIVDFAGIERFLDTPVKRYSSGMYVRLAFAVAAHLDSQILIVDEVLAVGDTEFQKKCLGKMGEVAKSGRTVMLVSHNMDAIRALCGKVLYLKQGQVREYSSNVSEGILRYLSDGVSKAGATEWVNTTGTMAHAAFQPLRFYIGNEDGSLAGPLMQNDNPKYVYIEGTIRTPDTALNVGYGLFDKTGTLLFWSATTDVPEDEWPRLSEGPVTFRSRLPARMLNEGSYRVELMISLYHREWISCPGTDAPSINIEIQGGLSDSPYWMERRPGVFAPVLKWTQIDVPEVSASEEAEVQASR